MKKFQAKWLWLLGILAVVLLVAVFLIPKKEVEGPKEKRTVISPTLITLQREEVPMQREATGVVTSASTATLASKVLGLVEEIRVREGEPVKAGEVLILLDRRDLQAQLERAEADLNNAAVQYQRMKKLFADESVARQELDNAERAYKVAEAAKSAIEANLTYATIRAPFDGVIAEKMIEEGELATPGRSLLRLEDSRHLRLEALVAETDIGALHLRGKVTVRLDALGDQTIDARVAQILPSADPTTHSFTVKASLPPQPGLKSGLFGRMTFPIGSRKTVLIPPSAVLERGALSYVYGVNEAGIIESRLVKLGRTYQGRIEVLAGLEPGDRVLERASEGLEGAQIPKGDRS
jgi:RND family efflux transporter MFP subunit